MGISAATGDAAPLDAAMTETGPPIVLCEESMRVLVEPGGSSITVEFRIEGETNAHWRNLLAEALSRRSGFRVAKTRVTDGSIEISQLPRAQQENACAVVAAAVQEANAPFQTKG